MSVDREGEASRSAAGVVVVKLACTRCELVYEPDFADFGTGRTGCPRCGGWTWIAQLATTPADVGGGAR